MSRQIVLDTETTGLSTKDGHRIIEIGCVEIIDRRLTGNNFHKYINPKRDIDSQALAVHGIRTEFLQDKPVFSQIAEEFLDFVSGSELIIHNAPFDISFLNCELAISRLDNTIDLYSICEVTDTLVLAKKKYPGSHNSLDALCIRLGIDNTERSLHGALLDAEILADVYLLMTGGQVTMSLDLLSDDTRNRSQKINYQDIELSLIMANDVELDRHNKFVKALENNT